jgi:hypothetical protein
MWEKRLDRLDIKTVLQDLKTEGRNAMCPQACAG